MKTSQQVVQDFLASRRSLIQTELKGQSGARTASKYSGLMDRLIRSLFHEAGLRDNTRTVQKDTLVLLALGSYGRRELCLESDVDLMVIHQGRLSPGMTGVIPG
ncbi:MAG: hypothetical protein JJE15_08270, partial [Desulfobacteraceae bacterium]|nr:hypothetical protein [Desulfobacteraceae bacterium]